MFDLKIAVINMAIYEPFELELAAKKKMQINVKCMQDYYFIKRIKIKVSINIKNEKNIVADLNRLSDWSIGSNMSSQNQPSQKFLINTVWLS